MAELPLSQTVDTSRAKRSWRSSVLSLFTSTLVQGLAITTLIVTPLLVRQSLPAPANRLKLPDFVMPTVPPPLGGPKRNPKPAVRREARRVPTIATSVFAPPLELGNDVFEESFENGSEQNGVPGGVPFGLPGAPRERSPEPVQVELDGPVEIGGEVRPPRKIVHVNPVYPPIALQARVEGTVTLQAILDASGNVVDLRVIQSIPLLDGAAIAAVERWKYEPTYLNGRAVPVVMSVHVEFQLR